MLNKKKKKDGHTKKLIHAYGREVELEDKEKINNPDEKDCLGRRRVETVD